MAFGITPKTGIDALWQGARSVQAVLTANPKTADLAAGWEALAGEINTVRTKRDDLALKTAIARAGVRVADAEWDVVASDLFRKADDLSDRKASNEPRRTLFGGIDRMDLLRAGAAKAVDIAGKLLAKLPAITALANFAEPLKQTSDALGTKYAARTAAEQAEAGVAVDRVRVRDAAEALAYKTEAELLSRFPGQRDLVRAYVTVIDTGDDAPKKDAAPSES